VKTRSLADEIAETTTMGASPRRALVESALDLLDKGYVYSSLLRVRPLLHTPEFRELYEPVFTDYVRRKLDELDYVDSRGLFPRILYLISAAPYKNFVFYGPPGSGKTYTIGAILNVLNIPRDRVFLVHPDRTRQDFKSNVMEAGIVNGSTVPLSSELGRAMELASGVKFPEDHPVAVWMEEMDRFPPGLLKQGNPFFDSPRREFHAVIFGREIRYAVEVEKLLVFGTFNATGERLGGDETEALGSRLCFVRFDEPSPDHLKEVLRRALTRRESAGPVSVVVEPTDQTADALVSIWTDFKRWIESDLTLGHLVTPPSPRDLISLGEVLLTTLDPDAVADALVSRSLYRMVPGINTTQQEATALVERAKAIANEHLSSLQEVFVRRFTYGSSTEVEIVRIQDASAPARQSAPQRFFTDVKVTPVTDASGSPLYLSYDTVKKTKEGLPVMAVKKSGNLMQVVLKGEEKGALPSGGTMIRARAESTEDPSVEYVVALVLDGKGVGVYCNCPSFRDGLEEYRKTGSAGEHNLPCKHVAKLAMKHHEEVLDHLAAIGAISKKEADDMKAALTVASRSKSVATWLRAFLQKTAPHMYPVVVEPP